MNEARKENYNFMVMVSINILGKRGRLRTNWNVFLMNVLSMAPINLKKR